MELRVFADLAQKKYLPESRAEDRADESGQVAYATRALMGRCVDEGARGKVLAKNWEGGKLRRKTAGDTSRPP